MPEYFATFLRHVPAANVQPELVIMFLWELKVISLFWANTQIIDSLGAEMNAVSGQIFASHTVIDDPTIMALYQSEYDNPTPAYDYL